MVIFGYFWDFGKTWKTPLLSTIVSGFWRFLRTLGDGIGIYLEEKIRKNEKRDFWENFAKLFISVFRFRLKIRLFVKIALFWGPQGTPCFCAFFRWGPKMGFFDVFWHFLHFFTFFVNFWKFFHKLLKSTLSIFNQILIDFFEVQKKAHFWDFFEYFCKNN